MANNGRLELLRSTMMGAEGREEKVEVNQRHLIDKILARYSAEYVLYRELMQNADDASSSAVRIEFQSVGGAAVDASKPPNLAAKCDKVIFKNNGIPFRPEDWSRLKRIAEGNPDEQKIGAFGVGFYSLFSVCENPFVSSGEQCMAFYFKGDQLFAKRADVPPSDVDKWTTFLMDLREPMEMPSLDDFAKFLATSMGFTANLREIEVFFDQHLIFSIKKRMAESHPMKLDPSVVHTVSPNRMFTITGASMRQVQLDAAKYTPPGMFSLSSLISRKEIDATEGLPMDKASIFLRVVTGALNVSVSPSYEREMERATKKKPPKTTTFQLVYTGKEEMDASEHTNAIFKDLIPFPHQGRVFIGFPTHQTTGCCSHMAARFIPTVERESIDFADRYISVWNKELLTVGGLLCRIVYNHEMEQIDRLYRELVGYHNLVDKSQDSQAEDNAKLMLEKRAAHALRSFTFKYSTPSPVVSKVQEERFFNASKAPAWIMSSHGVQSVRNTRVLPQVAYASLLDQFIKTVPTIPASVLTECKDVIDKFKQYGLLQPLDISDIIKELDTRPLSEKEMIGCMRWWIEHCKASGMPPNPQQFLDAAILDCHGEQLLSLSSVRWWNNPKLVPLDMPLPNDTLPFSVSKVFIAPDLANYFGGWSELSLLEWTKYIADAKKELETAAPFAERVLAVLSKGFTHLSSKAQTEICHVLKTKKCIPTKYGMHLPNEAYFPTVNLFDDLPIVAFQNSKSNYDMLLTALGVRKHVELQLVFDRLISDGSWSHVDLVRYLTSVQSTLSALEKSRLRETPIFTKEGEAPKIKEYERKKGQDAEGKPVVEKYTKKVYRRYKASELYVPNDTLRALKLPLIDWAGKQRWRSTSDEAKFLDDLGLQSSPPLMTLLKLASPETQDPPLQKAALAYVIDHYRDYQSVYNVATIDVAFLPCKDGKTYVAPRDVFTNPDVAILGFHVLHPDLIGIRDKLGVQEHPPATRIIHAFMERLTTDVSQAKRIFEYMAGRMSDFNFSHWQALRQTRCIPVKEHASDKITLVEPAQCYFESQTQSFHKELFLFVDFGELANSFLRSCGVKDEPTTVELATMVVKDPQRFWNLSGGAERYLSMLRQLAGQYHQLRGERKLMSEMRSTPFLVGIKRNQMPEDDEGNNSSGSTTEDFTYRLAKASDIFITDDSVAQQIFSPLSVPMEPLLEEFYAHLGSDKLSRQVKETYTYKDAMGVTTRSKAITDAIFERTPVIIHQISSDNPQRRKELCHDEHYVKRNLKVIQARQLRIKRKFKHSGEENVQPTTACADRSSFTIYISGTGEIDYYDVANALCTLLFTRVGFNDAIIVERYLTASLDSLRRKGVPVDRILNIRKNVSAQTPPVYETSPEPQRSLSPTLTPRQLDECTQKVLEVFSDCQVGYIRQLLAQERENHVENVINKLLADENYPKNPPQDAVESEDQPPPEPQPRASEEKRSTKLLDRLWSWGGGQQRQSKAAPPPPPPPPIEEPKAVPDKPKLPNSERTITPNYMSNVRQNLKRAIHSCKPYSGDALFSPPRVNQVAESNSYCDATPQQDLVSAGRVGGIEFYVHRGVEPDDVFSQYGGPLKRFAQMCKSLAGVFELKPTSVHVFYDTSGSTIAFNTNGSLFMNLRYYLALFEPASAAKRKEALIYWFMTMCHELAHNFVHEHSAQHEFYMSSFAESYLESFIVYLTSTTTTTTDTDTATPPLEASEPASAPSPAHAPVQTHPAQ